MILIKNLKICSVINKINNINLKELLYNSYIPKKIYKKRVTKSYRKGRLARVQQIYDKHGFVVKQIIHVMDK